MSNEHATAERILGLIADALNIERTDIGPQSTASDFSEWDSMGMMSLVLMLDSEFDMQLPPGQAQKLTSVPAILAVLKTAGKL